MNNEDDWPLGPDAKRMKDLAAELGLGGKMTFDDDQPPPPPITIPVPPSDLGRELNDLGMRFCELTVELGRKNRLITSLERRESRLELELVAAKDRAAILARELASAEKVCESLTRQLGRKNDRRGNGRRF